MEGDFPLQGATSCFWKRCCGYFPFAAPKKPVTLQPLPSFPWSEPLTQWWLGKPSACAWFVTGLVNIEAKEKSLQGVVAPLQAAPTMSLCDCVAPYAAIPLGCAAGCGVSGWTYPLLSIRLQEKTKQYRRTRVNRKAKTLSMLLISVLGDLSFWDGLHLRHLGKHLHSSLVVRYQILSLVPFQTLVAFAPSLPPAADALTSPSPHCHRHFSSTSSPSHNPSR